MPFVPYDVRHIEALPEHLRNEANDIISRSVTGYTKKDLERITNLNARGAIVANTYPKGKDNE